MQCDQCFRNFKDEEALWQHQRRTDIHAKEDTPWPCKRNGMEQFAKSRPAPLISSEELQAAARIDFVPLASRAADDANMAAAPIEPFNVPYIGVPSTKVRTVFAAALNLRFRQPSIQQIIEVTQTSLGESIVDVILEAAFRLLPKDHTPEGTALRKVTEGLKLRRAQEAEANFLTHLSKLGHRFASEVEQKARYRAMLEAGAPATELSTPDALFETPVEFCGQICYWVEYKNTFGFKASPFMTKNNLKQYKRYRSVFGPGAVVYRLGYESGLVQIGDVLCLREADVLEWIKAKFERKRSSAPEDPKHLPKLIDI